MLEQRFTRFVAPFDTPKGARSANFKKYFLHVVHS